MQTLKVASIQNQPEFGNIKANLHDLIGLLPPEVDLAVLPELCATGYQFRHRDELRSMAEIIAPNETPGPITSRLTEAAISSGITIVAGVAELVPARVDLNPGEGELKPGEPEKIYNSSVLIRPDGSREIYRKIHLFLDEKKIFDAGDKGFSVVDACGVKVGMMICFDWIFPESARTLALLGAQIIAHPSNLVLPWCPEAMITRSLENRVVTITANRTGREMRTDTPLEFIGLSQVVSPTGKILHRLNRTETGAAIATINIVETNKKITAANDLFADRRPEFYQNTSTS